MHLIRTPLDGLLVLEPRVHADERGFFFESFNERTFRRLGIDDVWRQDNHARSLRGVLRGLHYQRGPGQAKLVRCVRGRIWDVAVDIRPDSPTFRQWYGLELSEENKKILYVPTGFAHGYCVLSDLADVLYKCSTLYDPDLETGFAWNDPTVAVDWPLTDPLLSPRDQNAPNL